MKRISCWTGELEVSIAGKTMFTGTERQIDYLFQEYESTVSNTIPRERAEMYLKRAKALRQVLNRSIKELEQIITEYDESP